MRDPERIDGILARIGRVWKRSPDLRLGQIITNLSPDCDVFYIEDADLVQRIEKQHAATRPKYRPKNFSGE